MQAQKARKKPVEIEFMQLARENIDDVVKWCGGSRRGDSIFIWTFEGTMTASQGDYVIKGVQGEFYPCKPDIFKKTYDLVEVSA